MADEIPENRLVVAQQEITARCRALKAKLNSTFKDSAQCVRELVSLQKEVKASLKTLSKGDEEYQKMVDASAELKKVSQALKPDTGGLFVRLWLGSVNVKVYRESERWNLKVEYEKFKGRTNLLFIVGALTQILLENSTLDLLFQVWLCYYYSTVALRENILKANGSNINSWWITHHYLSILLSFVLLTWPEHEHSTNHIFRMQFGWFCLTQGLIQVLMNRYQLGRLYRAKAMGQAGKMDVAGEMEGVAALRHSAWSPTMAMIFPFLMFVQLFQVFNCITLFHMAYVHRPADTYYVVALGALFGILGFNNLYATLYTYYRKLLKSDSAKKNIAENNTHQKAN